MEESGVAENFGAEVSRQIVRRAEVNIPTDDVAEFEDHLTKSEHAGRSAGVKLHEHVNVAVGAEVVSQDASIKR